MCGWMGLHTHIKFNVYLFFFLFLAWWMSLIWVPVVKMRFLTENISHDLVFKVQSRNVNKLSMNETTSWNITHNAASFSATCCRQGFNFWIHRRKWVVSVCWTWPTEQLVRKVEICVSSYSKKIKNDIKYSMWFSNSITGMNLCPFLHVHIYPALCIRCK